MDLALDTPECPMDSLTPNGLAFAGGDLGLEILLEEKLNVACLWSLFFEICFRCSEVLPKISNVGLRKSEHLEKSRQNRNSHAI